MACKRAGAPAMKTMMVMRMTPPFPNRWYATAGGTSPEATSLADSGRSSARPVRPSVVARVNGTANHISPPRM